MLYAPTWEGDSEAMAYSSIDTVAEDILSQLVADERFEVRFRPHPKTGDFSPAVKKTITALRAEFSRQLDPVSDPGQSLAWADVAICDISAMAYDAVALNVPLFLAASKPGTHLGQSLPPEQLVGSANELADKVAALARQGVSGAQKQLANYYFTTTEPGRATEKLGELLREVQVPASNA